MEMQKTVFFEENERRMNEKVLFLIKWAVLAGPVMMLLKAVKVFKTVSYVSLGIFTVILILINVLMCLLHRRNPATRYLKYICLLSLELIVSYLAMTRGLHLFIAYVLVPVLSCMYYNEKFTLNISVVCYFVMVATFVERAMFGDIPPNFTRLSWGLAYASGSSIEYVLCVLIAFHVAKSARETLFSENERNQKLEVMQNQFIKGFANLVESKDASTGEHIKRTSEYVRLICKNLQLKGFYSEELSDESIHYMVMAAPLHDLGKISVSDAILTKPGELTLDEFGAIKLHPGYGAQLIEENLSDVEDECFTNMAQQMALYHHEKWDGTGYPEGLVGKEIPLCARIMAVADVLDALLSERPYKKAYSMDDVFKIMKEESGVHFDPVIIDTLMELRSDVEKISNTTE